MSTCYVHPQVQRYVMYVMYTTPIAQLTTNRKCMKIFEKYTTHYSLRIFVYKECIQGNGRKNKNKILKWSPHLTCFQTDVTIRTLHPTTGFVIYTSHVH